ncbi:copper resistance CopC family protein [Polymorphospora rubra]|uniref:Copper resistance protein n=1 Tax=Polymorphospora rubra TaxID=338584 RepID=A0A810MQS4_9ACTN|nr:copper resistance CopC family protein [Polymorphospora rubra]BCJ63577.1 copper resistance protein [Polymorphospora rubra]
MGGRGHRLATLTLGVIVGALSVLLLAGPAAAHNSFTGSDPENGATLDEAPETVQLRFLSRLDPATTKVTVTGPDGAATYGGEPTFDGNRVTVPFTLGPAGLYTVAYEVISGDTHPIKGSVTFTLSVGATPSVPPTPTAEPTPAPSSPAATPSLAPAAAENEEGPMWPWLVGGLVLVAAIVALVTFGVRRRRT